MVEHSRAHNCWGWRLCQQLPALHDALDQVHLLLLSECSCIMIVCKRWRRSTLDVRQAHGPHT
jgi:hypothetical protein